MNSDVPILEDAQGGVIVPRSKSLFPSGVSLGRNGSLDADDLARRALGTVNKAVIPDDNDPVPALDEPAINFSFKAAITGALEFTIQPGDIEIEPDTVIPWANITGASIINTVTPSVNLVWYGWCDINVEDGTATIAYGNAWPTALTTEQKANTVRRRLVHLVLVSDGGTPPAYSISAIKNLQCGNVDVDAMDEVVEVVEVPWTNGYVITQGATPTVSFTTGYLIWGLTRYTVGNAGSHNITTNNWWGIKMTSGVSAEWIEHANVNDFQDDASSFQQEYYQFQIVDGVASIKAVAACGNWKIPSVFAPE